MNLQEKLARKVMRNMFRKISTQDLEEKKQTLQLEPNKQDYHEIILECINNELTRREEKK